MATSQSNKSFTTPLLVGLLIVAVFVIGMMWQRMQTMEAATMAKGDSAEVAGANGNVPEQPKGEVTPIGSNDHVRGYANATIVWIEYSDYQCPFCGRIHPDLVKLIDEYEGQVKWVFRHFPLEQLHPNALPLALGAECVAELAGEDAYWEYTDNAFEQIAANPDPVDLGVAVGVSQSALEECIDSGRHEERVRADLASGQAAGVTGTPGNVILNEDTGEFQLIPGALPYEQLKAVVDGMLEG